MKTFRSTQQYLKSLRPRQTYTSTRNKNCDSVQILRSIYFEVLQGWTRKTTRSGEEPTRRDEDANDTSVENRSATRLMACL